jgi:hypothetical protein
MKRKETGLSSSGDRLPLQQSPPAKKQLAGKRAEKYLRDSGKIEELGDDKQEKATAKNRT